MNYKAGDRVKIKSLDWYNENKDEHHNVVFANGWYFTEPMSIFCGKGLIIERISHATNPPHYVMKDNIFAWIDEMIEGLAEELLDKEMEEHQRMCDEIMAIQGIEPIEAEMEQIIHCPEGYIFKDENGNVINATKIVLEKKKKEYPKTYEECCEIMQVARPTIWFDYDDVRSISKEGDEYERHIENTLCAFRKLLICRDAYWKIAGEKMRLGKPWEPDYNNEKQPKYGIYDILKYFLINPSQFVFPTPEMRDTFKENFDPDIEFCKELL